MGSSDTISEKVETLVTISKSTTIMENEQSLKTQPPAATIKKGSILNYFKPVVSSPSTMISLEGTSESTSTTPTPPSSPPQTFTRRKRRRLRIRALGLAPDDRLDASTDDETPGTTEDETGIESEDATEAGRQRKRNRNNNEPGSDEPTSLARDLAKQRGKRKATPMVQTTLNISAQAPISECKVCDTVWNPVIPKDARYHSRRHAAVLRARKRSSDAATHEL
jgi:hypothetical protein